MDPAHQIHDFNPGSDNGLFWTVPIPGGAVYANLDRAQAHLIVDDLDVEDYHDVVNAILDGLNLVAKEAPLVNERDAVVVLSENAGAHEELGDWVVSVNPFDVAAQAEALHEALTMAADERRERLDAIRAYIQEHDVAEWIEAQLADLDRCVTTVR